MTTHHLKTLPHFFGATVAYVKTFEIRYNDRDYQVGDILVLQEWTAATGFTGRETRVRVAYICDYAQQPGYVVMSTWPTFA